MPWVVFSVVLASAGLLVLAAVAVPVVREIRRLSSAVGAASMRLDQAAASLRAAGARLDRSGEVTLGTPAAPAPGGPRAAPSAATDSAVADSAVAAPVALPGMRRPDVPAAPVSHPHGVSS